MHRSRRFNGCAESFTDSKLCLLIRVVTICTSFLTASRVAVLYSDSSKRVKESPITSEGNSCTLKDVRTSKELNTAEDALGDGGKQQINGGRRSEST